MLEVIQPKAISHPETVMVKSKDALFTDFTVVSSWRLNLVTMLAYFELASIQKLNLLIFDVLI